MAEPDVHRHCRLMAKVYLSMEREVGEVRFIVEVVDMDEDKDEDNDDNGAASNSSGKASMRQALSRIVEVDR